MTTYYKATFSDGTVLKRSTAGRKYTHAYLSRVTYETFDHFTVQGDVLQWAKVPGWRSSGWSNSGFSGSEHLAQKALNSHRDRDSKYYRNVVFQVHEVAPAIEITRAEYRASEGGSAGQSGREIVA